MVNELSEMQKVLLETFKAFAEFCKQNDIKYFACYGTLLGAIRHKGFIPWDDDMDVYMLREDYDKFLYLKDKLNQESRFKLADYHDDGYPYDFAKFYDSTKTFWEFSHFPLILGPFIDIFPLEEWDEHNDEFINYHKLHQELFWKYRKSISHHYLGELFSDLIHLNLSDVIYKIGKTIIYRPQRRKLIGRLDKLMFNKMKIKGDQYHDYSGDISWRYDKSWFENFTEVPFEDTKINVPSGYDEYLRMCYGDYMTPPAEHRRTGHHSAFYINLNERLSESEILKLKTYNIQKRESVISMIRREWSYRHGKGD